MKRSPLKSQGFSRSERIEAREVTKLKMPKAEPKRRTRKCALKTCRNPFEPRSMTHKCCSPDCSISYVAIEKARKDRKDRQEGLAKLKRRADYLSEAQRAFNACRRAECELEGLPCVSCGRHHHGQNHAGHFLSVGAHPNHRFNPLNVWLQCQPCNVHLSGNALNYRRELVRRIGAAAVEAMESDNTPKKWSIDDLKAIKAHYTAKLKELKGKPCQE